MRLPVIVGLDTLGGDAGRAGDLASRLCSRVSGFKIGLPNLLSCGGIGEAVREACPDSLIVADLKLADIGNTMRLAASRVVGWSDAVIAHAFPGVEGGLDELKAYLDSEGRKLLLVAAMSNPGASRIADKVLEEVVGVIGEVDPWGVVAPATRPSIIRLIRGRFPGKPILSPGVGAQGAEPGSAVNAGASYEIIGRLIVDSEEPLRVVEGLAPAYKAVMPGGSRF